MKTLDTLSEKNTRLELAQIFAFEQSVITEYQQRLQNGEDFILLAKESMKKAGEDSTHYYMGWIGWKDMGIGPEDTAYSLEPGQNSTPYLHVTGGISFYY